MIYRHKYGYPKNGSATFYALACMGIGLALTATMTTYMARQFVIRDLPPNDILRLQWARKYARKGAPHIAAAFYSDAIQLATSEQQKHSTVLEMIVFLLQDTDWRPAHERYQMAAQYALALADKDLTNIHPARVAAIYLQLALTGRDERFLQQANRFLAMLRQQGKLPFALNLREFRTLLALDLPAPTAKSLEALRTHVRTRRQEEIFMQCEARVLWRAIRNRDWFDTVQAHMEGETPRDTLDRMHARLLKHANALANSSHRTIAQEALLMLAQQALQRNDTHAAINALRKAVFKEHAPGRALAAQRLLSLMRNEASAKDIAALQDALLQDRHLQHTVLADLAHELHTQPDPERVGSILATLDAHLDNLHANSKTIGNLLLKAATIAMERKEIERSEHYLATAEQHMHSEAQRIRQLSLRAQLAKQKGDLDQQIHYLYAILAQNPTQDVERTTRFALLQALNQNPMDTVDLAGNAMGATMRFPQDPRSTEGLLLTARQLENLSLYAAAEAYYRHAIIMSTTYNPADNQALDVQGQAMLGQARVLLHMDRNQDADRILRALCTHDLWADVWPASTPLWTAVAMRQGQYREAIRRWRQTCGPSNDVLLPHLFDILVPDLTTVLTRQNQSPRPAPESPPDILMVATANAVIHTLLQQNAYGQIEEILGKMENHAHWRSQVPLQQYRVQVLTQLLASEPADTVISWMERQAIHPEPAASDDTLLSTDQLRQWMEKSEQLSSRARTAML